MCIDRSRMSNAHFVLKGWGPTAFSFDGSRSASEKIGCLADSFLTGTTPHMSNPSSVRVPVLSKHTQSTLPDWLIVLKWRQIIGQLWRNFAPRFCTSAKCKKFPFSGAVFERRLIRLSLQQAKPEERQWWSNPMHQERYLSATPHPKPGKLNFQRVPKGERLPKPHLFYARVNKSNKGNSGQKANEFVRILLEFEIYRSGIHDRLDQPSFRSQET